MWLRYSRKYYSSHSSFRTPPVPSVFEDNPVYRRRRRERAYLISLILIRPWSFNFHWGLQAATESGAVSFQKEVEAVGAMLHSLDTAWFAPVNWHGVVFQRQDPFHPRQWFNFLSTVTSGFWMPDECHTRDRCQPWGFLPSWKTTTILGRNC